jgi:ABC-2 type transport system permease protein
MTWTVMRFDLRRSRTLMLVFGVGMALYGLVMAAFLPTIKENADVLNEYMDVFPQAFKDAFGIESGTSWTTVGGFLGIEYFDLVWVFIAAILAIVVGSRGVAAEFGRGTIEIPLATRLSRLGYLMGTIGSQVVVLLVFTILSIVGVLVAAPIVDVDVDPTGFLYVGILCLAFSCAIAGVTTLLSVLLLDRGRVATVTALVLVGMYLLNVIARIDDRVEWLRNVSAFNYFSTGDIIDNAVLPTEEIVLFAAVAVIGWVLALMRCRRRDLSV